MHTHIHTTCASFLLSHEYFGYLRRPPRTKNHCLELQHSCALDLKLVDAGRIRKAHVISVYMLYSGLLHFFSGYFTTSSKGCMYMLSHIVSSLTEMAQRQLGNGIWFPAPCSLSRFDIGSFAILEANQALRKLTLKFLVC